MRLQEKWRNKTYNIVAVFDLGQDLQLAEEFARRSNVAGLVGTFAELRDLIRLLLSEHFDHYVEDDFARQREFPNIEPSRALIVLSKYVEIFTSHILCSWLIYFLRRYKEMSLLSSVKNLPKHKRKQIDAMAKRIKECMPK